jgi:superfamily II DNA or RNA helicase
MSIELRGYQRDAINAVLEAKERGVARPLVALPTGTGKTVVFSQLIRERGGTALILAHRDELLGQAENKLRMVAPELGMSIGRVQAGRNDVGAHIVVASVQTLASEKRLDQLPREFDTVVVDEAHHATAATYRRILDHLDAELIVGVTATPERHDKSRLADVFGEIVYARSLLQMIQDGYLADLRGVRVELADLDLSEVKVTHGDYKTEDLARALTEAHAPEHTAAALAEHAPERKSIVFVPTVALAQATATAIDGAGIPAAAVWGDMPLDDRHATLRKFESGEVRAIANVDVLSEGFDAPSVDCIVIAAPTRSRIAYVQRVGRGTRLHPGKEDCLVLDMVGVSDDLKLQSLPDLFELESRPKKGETVSQAVDREAGERAQTEAELRAVDERKRNARDADLFGRDRLHWLHLGERWILPAGGDEALILDPLRDGAWRVLLMGERNARILARNLDLGYAQGAAEEAVRRRQAVALADTQAAWRNRPASPRQQNLCRRLGFDPPPDATAGQCSDAITTATIRVRLERFDQVIAKREAVPA